MTLFHPSLRLNARLSISEECQAGQVKAFECPWEPDLRWPVLSAEGPDDIQIFPATQTHARLSSTLVRVDNRIPWWAGDWAKPSKCRKSLRLIVQTTQYDERRVSIEESSLSAPHWQNTSSLSSVYRWTHKKLLCYVLITEQELFCFKNSSWHARLSHHYFS